MQKIKGNIQESSESNHLFFRFCDGVNSRKSREEELFFQFLGEGGNWYFLNYLNKNTVKMHFSTKNTYRVSFTRTKSSYGTCDDV